VCSPVVGVVAQWLSGGRAGEGVVEGRERLPRGMGKLGR
jgi:hypothetical protein